MTETKNEALEKAQRAWGMSLGAEVSETLRKGGGGPYGGDGGDGMSERIAKLEVQMDGLKNGLASIEKRLDRIEDKIPSKWDMAQVVFVVVGALMAAAIFGPRIAALFN